MNSEAVALIAADFDRAREDFLAEFLNLIRVDRHRALREGIASMEILQQIADIHGGENAR